jgi:hypothetical protein
MRTPFLAAAIASAPRMFFVFSVSGVCSAIRRQEGIVGDHLHPQADGAIGDNRTNIAAADHAERLAGDLDAHEAVLLPFAGLGRSIGLGDLAGQREHQRDGVLRSGDRIAERRVHHDDAPRRRRRNVDIVDADAGAANHFELCRLLQDFRCDLGGGAHREAVELADHRGKLVLVLAEIGLEVDLDAAILEDLDRRRRQGIGDEHAGSHGIARQIALMGETAPP